MLVLWYDVRCCTDWQLVLLQRRQHTAKRTSLWHVELLLRFLGQEGAWLCKGFRWPPQMRGQRFPVMRDLYTRRVCPIVYINAFYWIGQVHWPFLLCQAGPEGMPLLPCGGKAFRRDKTVFICGTISPALVLSCNGSLCTAQIGRAPAPLRYPCTLVHQHANKHPAGNGVSREARGKIPCGAIPALFLHVFFVL